MMLKFSMFLKQYMYVKVVYIFTFIIVNELYRQTMNLTMTLAKGCLGCCCYRSCGEVH